MTSITSFGLLKDLSLGMTLELLIVVGLIVLFIVSLCSILQKIRKVYENDAQRRVTVSQVYIQEFPPTYGETQGEVSEGGVYPGGPAPPSYTGNREYFDPPPKYDDIIKDENYVIITVPSQNQSQSSTQQQPQTVSTVTQA